MAKKNKTHNSNTIAENRKARHDYTLEQQYEAGVVLEGWEVKSMRDGRAQLKESYVMNYKGELFLVGTHISPLISTSSHIHPNSMRDKKLLLNKKEINQLLGATKREGYTIVPLALYWSHGRVKVKIALAKGKKNYDKRETIKQREWDRQKRRLLKQTQP